MAILPLLSIDDFDPGAEHVAEEYLSGKVFAIVATDDPIRKVLPTLSLDPLEDHLYLFIHGGEEAGRFENRVIGTHEIPVDLVIELMNRHYGIALNQQAIRLCTCYANLLRPGETQTLATRLLRHLPSAILEAYHGLVIAGGPSSTIRLGMSVTWDHLLGFPVTVGVPGEWELVSLVS